MKQYFEHYSGIPDEDGRQNRWKQSAGTSLTQEQKADLKNGYYLVTPKDKIFAMETDGQLWSIIPRNQDESNTIQQDLKMNGFKDPRLVI